MHELNLMWEYEFIQYNELAYKYSNFPIPSSYSNNNNNKLNHIYMYS